MLVGHRLFVTYGQLLMRLTGEVQNMSDLWIIGDPHFYHKNIISYENRPFSSVEEMNKALIDNWNSRISNHEKAIILGDFCFGANKHGAETAKQLNGYKILIMGNHDTMSPGAYLEMGFREVYRYPIIYDGFWMLSHEPLYINQNMPYANIFAHVHGNPAYADVSKQSFCASAERKALNYYPIKLSDIKKLMEEVE